MSKVDKTPGYFCTVDKTVQILKTGVMREFLLNAMGYATVVAMIISIICCVVGFIVAIAMEQTENKQKQ